MDLYLQTLLEFTVCLQQPVFFSALSVLSYNFRSLISLLLKNKSRMVAVRLNLPLPSPRCWITDARHQAWLPLDSNNKCATGGQIRPGCQEEEATLPSTEFLKPEAEEKSSKAWGGTRKLQPSYFTRNAGPAQGDQRDWLGRPC